ncbi:hypothetical protein Bca101_005538 [Brassica carinata]
MCTLMAMVKIVMRPKKMIAWTRIEAPLVCIFPNSTTRPPAGIWKRSPGVSTTNRITAIRTGPQSAMFLVIEREREREKVKLKRKRERGRERVE